MVNEGVSRVVEGALADHTKTLARCSSEQYVHGPALYSGMFADIAAIDIGDASANGRALGEIEFVCGAVDWVVFDGRNDVESGLLEAEAHTARPGEEVNGYGSCRIAAHRRLEFATEDS